MVRANAVQEREGRRGYCRLVPPARMSASVRGSAYPMGEHGLLFAFAELRVAATISAGVINWTVSASRPQTLPSTASGVCGILTEVIHPAALGDITAKCVTTIKHPTTTPHPDLLASGDEPVWSRLSSYGSEPKGRRITESLGSRRKGGA
jgi:hypothetical protein